MRIGMRVAATAAAARHGASVTIATSYLFRTIARTLPMNGSIDGRVSFRGTVQNGSAAMTFAT